MINRWAHNNRRHEASSALSLVVPLYFRLDQRSRSLDNIPDRPEVIMVSPLARNRSRGFIVIAFTPLPEILFEILRLASTYFLDDLKNRLPQGFAEQSYLKEGEIVRIRGVVRSPFAVFLRRWPPIGFHAATRNHYRESAAGSKRPVNLKCLRKALNPIRQRWMTLWKSYWFETVFDKKLEREKVDMKCYSIGRYSFDSFLFFFFL